METNKTKQATISAGRILLLCAIFGAALMGLMAEPAEDSRWWLELMLASKAAAAAGFAAFWRLYSRWSKTDKWIKAYDEDCEKALDTPNPCYTGREEEER